MKKRKQHRMIVTVSAPAGLTAAEVRREVRMLITHRGDGNIKASTVSPFTKAHSLGPDYGKALAYRPPQTSTNLRPTGYE
jgi:hypothetical protein